MHTEYESVYREHDCDRTSGVEARETVYRTEDVSVQDPETGEILDGRICSEETTRVSFTVYKSASIEKGLVSGWANVSKNADGSIPLDWQGDIVSADTLEDAAIDFMLNYRESGELHRGDSIGDVVESIVLTKDKQAAMGIPENTVPEGWFITVKLHDQEVINKVKSGEYRMFSIQGTAKRCAI